MESRENFSSTHTCMRKALFYIENILVFFFATILAKILNVYQNVLCKINRTHRFYIAIFLNHVHQFYSHNKIIFLTLGIT